MRTLKTVLAIVVLVAPIHLPTGLGQMSGPPPKGRASHPDAQRLQDLHTLVEKEIGTPRATDPRQCKSIAFGSKACGGPTDYLVYSTPKTDEVRLKRLVDEYNALSKKINRDLKLLSDCEFITEPKVQVVGGVCTAKDR